MPAIITKVSDHKSNYDGHPCDNNVNKPIRKKRIGLSMFTVVTSTGSKRKSTTVHGTRADAERIASITK